MKIVAIDASRGNYALNRTLFAVAGAAEDAGAEIVYLRLSDYRIMSCLGCKLCVMGEGCKMEDDLPQLIEHIMQANGIIISAPDDRARSSQPLRALLGRLSTFFEVNSQFQPTLPGMGASDAYLSKVARDTKRAIIITSSVSEGGIGTYFAPNLAYGAQIRRIRNALAACNIDAVGSMSIKRGSLRNDELCLDSKSRAISMGRLIVGKL
ncbi:MAG: NAD(P)H-dependent oxidoreductase [Coriobacteriia bacterium]|nr:NAD(P)H-dependent oxidoreductase [Coriobacteriia bacterium]